MQELTLPKAKPRVSPQALSPWTLPQWQGLPAALGRQKSPSPSLARAEARRGTGRVGSLSGTPWCQLGPWGAGTPLCTYLVVLWCCAGWAGWMAARQQLFLAQNYQGTWHGWGSGDPRGKGVSYR